MIKLHHLRDFIAIAQAQSVRGAARHLGLAQPALTRSLRELEQQLGVQLLQRHVRGVELTPEGQRYLQRARSATEELRRGQEEAQQFGGQMQGQVSAALSSAAMLALLPDAYSAFRSECPQVQLRLLEGPFPMIENRLREGSLDFYVGPEPERFDASTFHQTLCFRNQRQIVVRQGHPLRAVRTLRSLIDADWLVTGLRERYEQELEEQFRAHGLEPPRMRTRVDSMLGILSLLTCTEAVALLPRQCSESPMFAGLICRVPIRESLAAPDIVLIRRAGLPLTPAAQRFADLLRSGPQAG